LLLELVKLRASEIDGCAFSLNMHAANALKLGADCLDDSPENTPFT